MWHGPYGAARPIPKLPCVSLFQMVGKRKRKPGSLFLSIKKRATYKSNVKNTKLMKSNANCTGNKKTVL